MADVKVTLKLRGINALMRSTPVQRLVTERAQRMAAAAGENFEANIAPHKWTARAYVQPKNYQGKREQAKEHRLERALHAS